MSDTDEITRLRADLAQRTAERDALKADLNLVSVNAVNASLLAEVAALRSDLIVTKARVAEMQRDLAQRTAERAALAAEVAALKAERDEERRELCELLARSMRGPKQVAADRGWDCFKEVQP
jgi:uncharacterized protein involved in exopolysaccharide biosynthesis